MDIFCTHYQHPHTNQKGRLCHFLTILKPPLTLHEMGQGWHLAIPQWVWGSGVLGMTMPQAFTQDFLCFPRLGSWDLSCRHAKGLTVPHYLWWRVHSSRGLDQWETGPRSPGPEKESPSCSHFLSPPQPCLHEQQTLLALAVGNLLAITSP